MTQPFEPITVIEEFVYRTLIANATVTNLVGDAIYPALAPLLVTDGPRITHDFYGPEGGQVANMRLKGVGLLTVFWYITMWIPGMDRQPLRPVGKAIQAALAGNDVTGKAHDFISDEDSSRWQIEVMYGGPSVMPIDVTAPGIWQRIGSRYQIAIQPRS